MEWRVRTLCLVVWLMARAAPAITVKIDYTYDLAPSGGTTFFGNDNPNGPKAKAALEAAASFYSSNLTDSFNAITPPSYQSTLAGSTSVRSWSWTEDFPNPSLSASNLVLTNPPVGANQFVVYAGARSLSGLGQGAPGKVTHETFSDTGTGGFNSFDNGQMNTVTLNFDASIGLRGQPSGEFARWGGWVSFDNDGSTPWFFDFPSAVPSNKYDFYSVALHELGHTLGFGEQTSPATTAWQSKLSGTTFIGANAKALNGGNPVPLDTTVPNESLAHWVQNQMSVVYGTSTPQEVVMDPNANAGVRKKLTALDATALQDIGWVLPPLNGDYNNNYVVDAADYIAWRKNLNRSVTLPNDTSPGTVNLTDYTVWRTSFGNHPTVAGSDSLSATSDQVPEPSAAVLMVLLGVVACFVRRRS